MQVTITLKDSNETFHFNEENFRDFFMGLKQRTNPLQRFYTEKVKGDKELEKQFVELSRSVYASMYKNLRIEPQTSKEELRDLRLELSKVQRRLEELDR